MEVPSLAANDEITRLLVAELPRLRLRARIMVGDAHLADDILQEVAVVVLRQHASFQLGTNFSAWVNEIHRRVLLAECRKRHQHCLALDPAVIDDIAAVIDEPDERERERTALAQCLQVLPGDGRKALRLRYWNELPSTAIAKRMRRSVDGVKSLLKRVRQMLNECIEERLQSESAP